LSVAQKCKVAQQTTLWKVACWHEP